jgi:hypothetical protein
MSAYNSDFPVGSLVRVASRKVLERFKEEWQFHHPLQTEQLEFAGVEAEVVSVGYYHGGDVLCWLQAVPGVWHERCLERARAPRQQ